MRRVLILSVFTVALLCITPPAFSQFHMPVDYDDDMPWTMGPTQQEGVSSTNMFYESMMKDEEGAEEGAAEGTAIYYLWHREDLNLSEEQISKIKNLQVKEIETSSELRKQYKIANQELNDMLEKEDPDLLKVDSKIREIERMRSEYELVDIKNQIELKKTLTPEQSGFYLDIIKNSREQGFKGFTAGPYRSPGDRRQNYERMKRNRGY